MIGIERVPEPGTVDPFERGLLLPVPGLQRNTVMLEPRDGGNIQTIAANAVLLERNGVRTLRARKVKITVFITDARVALACSKYEKGGGWYGTSALVLVFNAASKARAAMRRHGKMLVGQVRYPWIQNVGSTPRKGYGTKERVVLEAKSDQGTTMRITLFLPNNVDAALVAAEIARRAAHYRLASESDLAADKRAALETLTAAPPLAAGAKNIIQFHRMPNYYFVGANSARFMPRGTGGAAELPAATPTRALAGSASANPVVADRALAGQSILAPLASAAPAVPAPAPSPVPVGATGSAGALPQTPRTSAETSGIPPGQKIVIGLDDLGSDD